MSDRWCGIEAVLKDADGEQVYIVGEGSLWPVIRRDANETAALKYIAGMISKATLKIGGKLPRTVLIPKVSYGGFNE